MICRKKELNDICGKWLYASSYRQMILSGDKEHNKKIKNLKYLLASIRKYYDERDNYDNEVSKLSFDIPNEIKKQKKKSIVK